MRSSLFALFRLLLPLVAFGVAAPAPAKAPPAINWARAVTVAPDGARVYGNPKAANKVTVYVGYTCPHCAHFEQQGMAALMAGWVRTGKVEFTVRNLVRDRYDLTAALLARCGGPARFLGDHHAIFGWQNAWIDKIRAYETAASTLPATASQTDVMRDIANRTGLTSLMARRGISVPRQNACLADKANMEKVLGMTKYGVEKAGVSGTPSFIINGALTEAHDWDSLRALLPGGLPASST